MSLINKIIEKTLDQFLKIDAFQRYVNHRSNLRYGCRFKNHSITIEQVFEEYKFNDIRPDDIVLDIGANVGGFSLFVSRMVKKVYAVEPIVTNLLKENISLNKIDNIVVLDNCLGDGIGEVLWDGEKKIMFGTSLTDLITLCGGHIDFLKCDCEGGEWCIKAEELRGIRRIEMEVHNCGGRLDLNNYFKILDDAGFKYTCDQFKETDIVIHATRDDNIIFSKELVDKIWGENDDEL